MAVERKRGPTEIIVEILSVASRGGVTKTSLVYKVNLNFTRIEKYIKLLIGKEMIEVYRRDLEDEESPITYRTTGAGLVALRMLKDSNDVIFGDRKPEIEYELSVTA